MVASGFVSSLIRDRKPAAAILLAAALALSACGGDDAEGEAAPGMGDAAPAAPADRDAEPAGAVTALDREVTGAVRVGGRILLRAGDAVLSGTAADPAARVVDVDPACGRLAPAGDMAVLPCPDGIHVLAPDGSAAALVGKGTAYTAAVGLGDGRIIGHRAEGRRIDVYGPRGELDDDFDVSRHGSQLLAVPGAQDLVLEINVPETSIHEVELADSRSGSGLRAGLGIAGAAAGADGTIAAVDATGGQLLIYTATDVIRLHQAFPVPGGPWSVHVDDARGLVWVGSTGQSLLTAWDISGGTGVEVARLDAVRDPRAIAGDGDGGLMVYSGSGAGAQHLDRATVDRALAAGAADAGAERATLSPETR